jgi:hypothetical protein
MDHVVPTGQEARWILQPATAVIKEIPTSWELKSDSSVIQPVPQALTN